MTGLQIACSIVLIVVSFILIVLVLAQKNRQADASAVNGGASNSFFDKTQGHSKDALLAKLTIAFGVILVIATIATLAINLFV